LYYLKIRKKYLTPPFQKVEKEVFGCNFGSIFPKGGKGGIIREPGFP